MEFSEEFDRRGVSARRTGPGGGVERDVDDPEAGAARRTARSTNARRTRWPTRLRTAFSDTFGHSLRPSTSASDDGSDVADRLCKPL
mgnify:CR=1 FL=1